MKTTKFYKLVIACLVVINLVTLSFLFLGKRGHRPPGHLSKIIGLTGEKLNAMEKVEKDHHTEKRALMKRSKKLYFSLYQTLGDEDKGKTILDSLEVNNQKIDSMTYEFFSIMAANCNEKQLKELNIAVEKGIGHLWNKKTRR